MRRTLLTVMLLTVMSLTSDSLVAQVSTNIDTTDRYDLIKDHGDQKLYEDLKQERFMIVDYDNGKLDHVRFLYSYKKHDPNYWINVFDRTCDRIEEDKHFWIKTNDKEDFILKFSLEFKDRFFIITAMKQYY